MIDRKQWTGRHDPMLTRVDAASPLTVGNGDFAFTADITGLQTLSADSAVETPLCTMSNWSWHTRPAPTASGRYTLKDVQMDTYDFCGRPVTYPVTRHPGNGAVYDWLRQNPHKASLARIGLRMNGQELKADDFSAIRQRLLLYAGTLESAFTLRDVHCRVRTACAPDRDALAFLIDSPLLAAGLTVDLDFPLGAPDISGADWESPEAHETKLEGCLIRRRTDDLSCTLRLCAPGAAVEQVGPHRIRLRTSAASLSLAVVFSREEQPAPDSAQAILDRCARWWAGYWEKGGALAFSAPAGSRPAELERRVVLSLYLLAIQSAGHIPPAETGLTCNSWYGKAHLEMHFWHMAWAPLWGHGELLERCLPWYHRHLPQARANAARNGYKGTRWPKMIAEDAVDSPSPIAVLLVWQQPHILVMLELLRRSLPRDREAAFLREHWPLVRETADFMADYAVRDAQGIYHLEPPLIPVQERYDPRETRDPAFEVAYWRFGLELALRWAERAGEPAGEKWRDAAEHMAPPPLRQGLYIAHANRPDTFDTVTEDHPSMLQCLGLLPGLEIDRAAMAATLDRVLAVWDESSLWGWDFAVLAMTAARLGRPDQAADLLMRETGKNTYVASGNNRQVGRSDLPLYLPGNGSLLLAAALLAAEDSFPREDGWHWRSEGLQPPL